MGAARLQRPRRRPRQPQAGRLEVLKWWLVLLLSAASWRAGRSRQLAGPALQQHAPARVAPAPAAQVAQASSALVPAARWALPGLAQLQASSLRGLATCPDGCSTTGCVAAGTAAGGGFRCIRCRGTLVVDKQEGTCACAPGKYSDAVESCADCPIGSFCPGGRYNASSPPARLACPANMTTLSERGTSVKSCVNAPGFYYVVDGPTAIVCPADTIGPGLRKQRRCVPCPTGFTTDGLQGQSSSAACVVAPGYYGDSALPCPIGRYKAAAGPAASCTPCPSGVTTASTASSSAAACSELLPGYYAARMASGGVTLARACPQAHYCPGGEPLAAFDPRNASALSPAETTIVACPDGQWTLEPGATAKAQCLTPPGFYTRNGSTLQCAAGSYRAGWETAGYAASCTPCGTGVSWAPDGNVTVYSAVTGASSLVAVMTSAASCYIRRGQGLYYLFPSATWRARNCSADNWGVNATTYGQAAPNCRSCPEGMVASRNASYPLSASYFVDNGDGTGGFVDKLACVNRPGWGLVLTGTRASSQPCPLGSYNAGDTHTACSACGTGLSTAAVGAGVTSADCGIGAGFGYVNGSVQACPIGTYNSLAFNADLTAPCTACPTGTTTASTGAATSTLCSLCAGGWAGANCSTQCGGSSASYGLPDQPMGSPCGACANTSFTFSLDAANASAVDVFVAGAVARAGADTPGDCLAAWAQYAPDTWELPLADNASATLYEGVASFAACLALCAAPDCAFATYDYSLQACLTRNASAPELLGAPIIALRLLPAGNASGVSGKYSFYQEPYALLVGTQTAPPGAAGFTAVQQCLDACDADTNPSPCAGVTLQLAIDPADVPRTCLLIRGSTAPTYRRTAVRADTDRLSVPLIEGYAFTSCYSKPSAAIANGLWPACSGTLVGGVCAAACTYGGSATVQCLADGSWSGSVTGSCNVPACYAQPLATVSDGSWPSCSGTAIGGVCTASCTYGGSATVQCLAGGSWSGSVTGLCNVPACYAQPSATVSDGSWPSCSGTAIGGVCTASCTYGGSATVQCLAGGSWSGSVTGSCNVPSCASEPTATVEYGSWPSCSGTLEGASCAASCFYGGSASVNCASGSWNATVSGAGCTVGGTAFVVANPTLLPARVHVCTLTGGAFTSCSTAYGSEGGASAFAAPRGVYAHGGRFYVAQPAAARVHSCAFDASTNDVPSCLESALPGTVGVTVRPVALVVKDGVGLIANNDASCGIIRCTNATDMTDCSCVADSGASGIVGEAARGIALSPDGGTLYVTREAGAAYALSTCSLSGTTLASCSSQTTSDVLTSLAASASGLYVVDHTVVLGVLYFKVLKCSLASPDLGACGTSSTWSNALLFNPWGIAAFTDQAVYVPDLDRIYRCDDALGSCDNGQGVLGTLLGVLADAYAIATLPRI